MDVQAVRLHLFDLEVADDGPTDGQPADRQGTDGPRPKGRGSDRGCPKAGRWPPARSMDAGGAHGAPGPGVAAELIRRSMASSQVMDRAEPWTVQKVNLVGPIRGRSLRMTARWGMARAKASRWAWSVQADRVQKVPFIGWASRL